MMLANYHITINISITPLNLRQQQIESGVHLILYV
jgi:hypothetical protein